MIAKGSKSFSLAARLFDASRRNGAISLYAWCRRCDDEIDGSDLGMRKNLAQDTSDLSERLASLRERTGRAYAGETQNDTAFDAFAVMVREFSVPEDYPLELLEGMAMDVRRERYETLEDLLLYCYRVAGTVGLMMSHVMGLRDERYLRNAADLGLAMQLTNIARDVREDFENGRVYLPLAWLREAGVPAEELMAPEHRKGLVAVVGRLLECADRLYASGRGGLFALPFRSACAVLAAGNIYAEIGRVVRARGNDAWSSRSLVSGPRKISLAVRACLDISRTAPERRGNPWKRAEIRTIWKPFSSEVRA